MGVDDIYDCLGDVLHQCGLGVLEFDVKSYTALKTVCEEVVLTMFVKIIIVYNDRVIKA